MADGSIDFDHVTFKYSEKAEHRALAEIDLHIRSGETIGVMGGTGSAKTSLVNLISRLYDVTEGSVKVGGVDVRDYDLEFLRNNVAVVLQKNVLFSGTIKENLRWGNPDATYDELVEVCKLAQADEFIQQLPKKYDYYIEQGGTNVSGGQKQRLCIARALLKHPKVLILDDSTSAVDTKTDALIREGPQDLPARGHQDHHRAAHELGHGRGPHPRARQRPHRGARHPRRAHGELPVLPRHLPRPEPHEPGGREGRRRRGRRGREGR